MDIKEALHKAERLREQAILAAVECQELSCRMVSAEITYHMPDSPHVMNTFVWQQDDRFDAGDKIVEDLTAAKELFQIREDDGDVVKAFNDAMTFYQASVKQAWGHVEKLKRTADCFGIPFNEHGSNFHSKMIDDVPFEGLRKFLDFWREEIEGPLCYVEATHTASMKKHVGISYFHDGKALIM